MKKFLFLFLIIGLHHTLAAQQANKTRVVRTEPKQPVLEAKLNRQIAGLTDEVAVLKIVYSQVSKLKIYITICVDKGSGRLVSLVFNPAKTQSLNGNTMVFESKGVAGTAINSPDDFSAMPDTIALLDTLKLKLRFNSNKFPDTDYYIRWKPIGKVALREERLKPGSDHTLIIPGSPGIYRPFELKNLETDNRILLGSNLYLITGMQLDDLRNMVREFVGDDRNITRQTVIDLVSRYVTVRYGNPVNSQILDWVTNNFKDLSP